MNFRRPVLVACCEDATIANFLPAVLSAQCKDATIVNFLIAVSEGIFSDVVVFGQVLCVLKHVFSRFWYTFVRGVPPEAYQGRHSEAQWCHMVPRCAFSSIFHRFWGPFWEAFSNMLHHFRHPVSECFFEGV